MTKNLDPEKRRQDFLETSLKLFTEKGYEKTTVNDIINAMGLSKGAFYHYFKSKEDVVEQITNEYAEKFFLLAEEIGSRKDMDAVEKINKVFQMVQVQRKRTRAERERIRNVFQENSNLKLQQMLFKKFRERFRVSAKKIIQEGISEGLFGSFNPEEAADFLLLSARGLNIATEELAMEAYTANGKDLQSLKKRMEEKLDFYENALGRVFELKKRSFAMKEPWMVRFNDLID